MELKKNFPDLEQIARTEVKDIIVHNPQWVSGFTTGEGCFAVSVESAQTTALKYTTRTRFILTQHKRDYLLMESFKEYFKCGSVILSKDAASFMVNNISELNDNILAFFNKYPIMGKKHLDYLDFRKVVNLKLNKSHLTVEGLNEIRSIVNSMNSKR